MSRILIKGGRVLDPSNDTDREADLLVEDGRIAAVGPEGEIRDADVLVDGATTANSFRHPRESTIKLSLLYCCNGLAGI